MKKCLVLDLDNTLWGGVVGEDGRDGIALSLSSPGNSFMAFQQAILDHYDRGVILAINSRNNENDVWDVIRNHPNMILKEHHFAASRINWNDKASNIIELAKELNIGLDSMVFLDDDPTNRAMVRALVKDVEVPELPVDPKDYTQFLNSLPYFESLVITDEDKMRGNLYVTERLRREEEKQYESKENFLKSLDLSLFIFRDENSCISRLSQLTGKTNQFNTLKRPLSEEEIDTYVKSENHYVYYARLQDKFGDYGVILFALIERLDKVWNIKSLLMSCRVFGKGVEKAFFDTIVKQAKDEGINLITIEQEETEKNLPAREFIKQHFIEGKYEVKNYPEFPSWIKINI